MDAEPWIVVGASRGIGLEFVKQLLEAGQQVLATVRSRHHAKNLFDLIASQNAKGKCIVEECDISSDQSITVSCSAAQTHVYSRTWAFLEVDGRQKFVNKVEDSVNRGMKLGNVILNAAPGEC